MADLGLLTLAGLGISLGLRHGIDWDHIAAITDITGSVVTTEETNAAPIAKPTGGSNLSPAMATATAVGPNTAVPTRGSGRATTAQAASAAKRTRQREARDGVYLATFYALGHASMVVILGLLALWVSEILPSWLDPLMERVVGVTLLLLGVWIVYSLVRYGSNFRLQSRWMLVFSLIGSSWRRLRGKEEAGHSHVIVGQYGPRTAFGIGLLHGVGAETGSQALLLASVAGATSQWTGSYILLFFTFGLIMSNTIVAILSSFGFVSAGTKKTVYLVIGVFAAIFSLVVGAYFVTGNGGALPDLGHLLGATLEP